MLPPAPGRFSTMTEPPSLAPSALHRMRAMMSVGPAGANGTITRTARVG